MIRPALILIITCLFLIGCGSDDDSATNSVAITSPAESFVWGDSATLTAVCSSGRTITRVTYYDGENFVAADSTAPYECTWPLTGLDYGTSHSFTARMETADGAVTVSPVKTLRRMPFPFYEAYLANIDGIEERDANGLPGTDSDARDWMLNLVGGRSTTGPRYASITDVRVYSAGRKVFLSWATISELDNAGFYIHRATIDGNEGWTHSVTLNPGGIIPGVQASDQLRDYAFTDSLGIEYGVTYYYWLESVDTNQQTEHFGPYTCSVPAEVDWDNAFYPAFPNPVTTTTSMLYSLAEPANSWVILVSQDRETVEVLQAGEFVPATSNYRLFCDLEDREPGLYRCVYRFLTSDSEYWGTGDILVQ
jgi:hypothetical protein